MFTPLLIYAVITSFTPGPNNIMAITFSNTYGFKKTVGFCIGVGFGFFTLLILSSFFNVLLHQFIPQIELFMGIIGATYLCYLAYIILKSSHSANSDKGNKFNRFISGFLLQFMNPKAILYTLTVIGTFVLPYYTAPLHLLLFSILLGVIGLLGSLSWAVFGSLFKKFLANYRLPFNIVMAVLLVYTAITILWR